MIENWNKEIQEQYHVLDCLPEPVLTLSTLHFSLPLPFPITEHYHFYKLNIPGTSTVYLQSLCSSSSSLACSQLLMSSLTFSLYLSV